MVEGQGFGARREGERVCVWRMAEDDVREVEGRENGEKGKEEG